MGKLATNNQTKIKTKECVDFIYELLKDQGWVRTTFSSLGWRGMKVGTVLIRRGIVERRRLPILGKTFEYRWAADMAPTKVLYDNICSDIAKDKKENKIPESGKSKSVQKDVNPIPVFNDSTAFLLIEYKEESVHFHYEPIRHEDSGYYTEHGIGTYGWRPIAVISKTQDDARFSKFLAELEEKNHSTEDIQNKFADRIKDSNLWHSFDSIDTILPRIHYSGDIFLEDKPPVNTLEAPFNKPISAFSDQELLDELKSRGWTIGNGELVKTSTLK